jgi:multisubunit Na+/H+ antiporter MnhE subunit
MTYVGPMVWLTALWLVLWRSTSPGAIVTGIALAIALTWVVRRSDDNREHHRVRPLALLRYFGHMVFALVQSNVALAWEVLTPTDYTKPGLLEVQLPPSSELVLTVIANSITLTPGTMTLGLRAETSTLVIHVLHLRDVDEARAEIEELHRLVSAALVHVSSSEQGAGTA